VQIATFKHIHRKDFSTDLKGKDTWRYSEAGANPIVSVSNEKFAIVKRKNMKNTSLHELLTFAPDANVIILEGFSHLILKNEQIGKIICVRNKEDYVEYKEGVKGEVIAFCTLQYHERAILNIKEEMKKITSKAIEFIDKRNQIINILSKLPKLDCQKCGLASCEDLAQAILRQEAQLTKCHYSGRKPKNKTKIFVNASEIPLQFFVSEIIRKSVLGMITTLKGTTIQGEETIRIEVSN